MLHPRTQVPAKDSDANLAAEGMGNVWIEKSSSGARTLVGSVVAPPHVLFFNGLGW